MGKGRVAILGEAAHPLRPTGQDTNMALEDAAELAAFIQVRAHAYVIVFTALHRFHTNTLHSYRSGHMHTSLYLSIQTLQSYRSGHTTV